MKLDKDESDSSNYVLNRIKNNMPRTMKELERFNSAYNQRPFTSFKGKKREFEKKQSFTRNNNYIKHYLPKNIQIIIIYFSIKKI